MAMMPHGGTVPLWAWGLLKHRNLHDRHPATGTNSGCAQRSAACSLNTVGSHTKSSSSILPLLLTHPAGLTPTREASCLESSQSTRRSHNVLIPLPGVGIRACSTGTGVPPGCAVCPGAGGPQHRLLKATSRISHRSTNAVDRASPREGDETLVARAGNTSRAEGQGAGRGHLAHLALRRRTTARAVTASSPWRLVAASTRQSRVAAITGDRD